MNEEKHRRSNLSKWNRWAQSADGRGWRYEYLRKAQAYVIGLAAISQNVNFLDIGCGTGHAVGLAAEKAGYTGNFYGVDISERMIEKARQNFRQHCNIRFIKSSSEAIPLQGNFFDTIICTNSFHHYLHPEKAMSEMYRLLKPDGRAFILDPVSDIWVIKAVDLLIGAIEPAHVRFYSSEEYRSLMTGAGLLYEGYVPGIMRQKVQLGLKVSDAAH